jgi:glycosyltransferase involved in cell wall biosynthesis
MKSPILGIIVPSYNEEAVLKETADRLVTILDDLIYSKKINEKSFILFVDDGSIDDTWKIIKNLAMCNPYVRGLKLSRNYGHQNALLAGLLSVKDKIDFTISIDADLQQDENAIYKFIDRYYEGYDIVYGIRKDRRNDGAFKKLTALLFYKLMNFMGVKIIQNHADYRLVSKKVLNALADFGEVNLFLRGLLPSLGFRTTVVMHDVRERLAGKSKYSLKVMLSLALNGITSFSIMPVRMISFMGFIMFLISILMSIYVVYAYLSGRAIAGWPSTVIPIYFIGGVQLLCLGLLGEYIGKIYMETKRRPRFIIEEEI